MISGAKGFITNLFGDGNNKGKKQNTECGDLIDEISAIRTLARQALKADDPTEGLEAIIAITDGIIDGASKNRNPSTPRRTKRPSTPRRKKRPPTVALVTDSDTDTGSEISSTDDEVMDTSEESEDDDGLDDL
jgi:hypothetical protein